ncbi:LysR family transcriptional regulator [Kribbella sp. NPDC051770]|uniref:LysR family transcriptional regulator n=1 Tax=Kribbella sp. NPDC051770 TaxID=3155413 RepID=UPI0034204CC8
MSLPNVSPRQLEYLVAIAETGGITAAAARCHVSQSAVSLAVGELERALEVRLVLRGSRRGTRLTAAGQQVVVDGRKVLAALTELGTGARSLGQEVAGRLVVGCYAPIAPFHLPAAIAGFGAVQPAVTIEFAEGTLTEVQESLLDGRSELAFLYQQDLLPGIEVEVLHDRPPSVLLPAGHRLRRRRKVGLADLAAEPYVLLDVPPSERYFARVFEAAGLEMRPAHRAGSFELMRALVARGIGYSLAVQTPLTELSYEGLPLLTKPLADAVPTTPVVLGWAAGSRTTRRAAAFREHCRELFRS